MKTLSFVLACALNGHGAFDIRLLCSSTVLSLQCPCDAKLTLKPPNELGRVRVDCHTRLVLSAQPDGGEDRASVFSHVLHVRGDQLIRSETLQDLCFCSCAPRFPCTSLLIT